MTSKSIQSCREAIYHHLQQCRRGTFQLFSGTDYDTFCRQAHPDFSPVGWHLGHIAYTEDLWLLQHSGGFKPVFPEYHKLFAADILPKKERVYLPTMPEVELYLDAVRKKVLDYLEIAPIEQQQRLWQFIIQHESQHCETVAFLLQMQEATPPQPPPRGESQREKRILMPDARFPMPHAPAVEIPAGEFYMGSDAVEALDNERSRHRCYLDKYSIDLYQVTCSQYRDFMAADGYKNPLWWSVSGWEWLQSNPVYRPLYWSENPAFNHHPVCGVSWYEAEAYCNFTGKRLPTESEWEKAASWDAQNHIKHIYPWGEVLPNSSLCNHGNQIPNTTPVDRYPSGASPSGCYDMLGNVWEWTASTFEPYPGFESYPYRGYSQAYFDGEHRVLKGGSWATPPQTLRASFRNWYHPGVRQIIAGFRCAS